MNTELTKLAGVGPSMAARLGEYGFSSVEKIAKSNVAELSAVPGIGAVSGARLVESAREMAPHSGSVKIKKPSRKAGGKKSKQKAEKKKKASKDKPSKKEKSSKKEKKSAKKKAGKKSDKKRKKKKAKR